MGYVSASPAGEDLRAFGRGVATTSVCNVAAAVCAGVAGIVIARALGPTVRGEYAAVIAWFGVVLVIGELGQTAATTYFVARYPRSAPDYLASSRHMLVVSGSVTLVLGMLVAPLLSGGNSTVTWGYLLMFGTCLASFVSASYTFSLQAVDLRAWNVARLSQPVGFVLAVLVLRAVGVLGLISGLLVLAGTIVGQTLLAQQLCRRQGLTGGRRDPRLARRMRRYGLSQLAAAVPSVLVARLDQLLLSVTVAPAELGRYAVAVSVTTLAVPVVSALGSVAFPRLASRMLSAGAATTLQRRAVLASAGMGLALMIPVAVLAHWFIPAIFGAGFVGSVPLVLLLAPSGVMLPCAQVCADLLRGYGRPLDVARAQAWSAALTVILLVVLLPIVGVAGAAITATATSVVTVVLLLRALRRHRIRREAEVAMEPAGVS